ncbi:unnamed protein product, partial [Ostreobium quekettii]
LFSAVHPSHYLSPTDELWKLTEVFLNFPGNTNYPLHATFLNLAQGQQANLGNQADRSFQEWLSVKEAAKGLAGVAEGLVPVDAAGFPDLRDRMLAQTETLGNQKAWIEKLQALVDGFRRMQEEKVTDRLRQMQENIESHRHRLLKVVRKLDNLEYKFAKEWHQGRYTLMDTQRTQSQLQQYEQELNPLSGGGLKDRVDALARLARLRKGPQAGPQGPPQIGLADQEDLVEVYHFLQGHVDGARAMQDTVRRLKRDMTMMMEGGRRDDTGA